MYVVKRIQSQRLFLYTHTEQHSHVGTFCYRHITNVHTYVRSLHFFFRTVSHVEWDREYLYIACGLEFFSRESAFI